MQEGISREGDEQAGRGGGGGGAILGGWRAVRLCGGCNEEKWARKNSCRSVR